MRSSFSSTLRFGLVSLPVKAFSAHKSSEDIRLNQLHADCCCRVKYEKVCPEHGKLSADEIVKGYEYQKGQYVILDPEELKTSDKYIDVLSFVKDNLDYRYVSGKRYYLTPDGEHAQKAYHLLAAALKRSRKVCMVKAIIAGREQLARIIAVDGSLCLEVLYYAAEVRQVSDLELGDASHTKEELKLTLDLIKATNQPFEISEHTNPYNERVRKIIDAKVDGQETVSEPVEDKEPAQVINLAEALKKSLERKVG